MSMVPIGPLVFDSRTPLKSPSIRRPLKAQNITKLGLSIRFKFNWMSRPLWLIVLFINMYIIIYLFFDPVPIAEYPGHKIADYQNIMNPPIKLRGCPLKHICYKKIQRYKMTSKYCFYSPIFFGKFFVVVKISFRLF